MKNILKAAVLSILMVAMPISKSHAIVGVATGNAPLALAGLASPAVGYGMVFVGSETGMCHEFECISFFALGIVGGLIMLDEDESTLSFQKLDSKLANKYEIDAKSMNIYNSEIEEVNAIFEEVTSNLDKDSTIEDAQALWTEYREYISVQTYEVMQKIN